MRSKRLPSILLLMISVAAVSLAGLLASCRRVHEDRAEVRVAYLQIIPSLPVFVAQEQGLFDQENLRLKAIALSSSNDLVNAMAAGQADILPGTSLVPIIQLEIHSPGRVRIFSHSRMNDSNALDKIIVKEASPIHALEGFEVGATDSRYAHEKCDYYQDHRLDSIGRNHVTGNLLGELVPLHAQESRCCPAGVAWNRACESKLLPLGMNTIQVRILAGSGHSVSLCRAPVLRDCYNPAVYGGQENLVGKTS